MYVYTYILYIEGRVVFVVMTVSALLACLIVHWAAAEASAILYISFGYIVPQQNAMFVFRILKVPFILACVSLYMHLCMCLYCTVF